MSSAYKTIMFNIFLDVVKLICYTQIAQKI